MPAEARTRPRWHMFNAVPSRREASRLLVAGSRPADGPFFVAEQLRHEDATTRSSLLSQLSLQGSAHRAPQF